MHRLVTALGWLLIAPLVCAQVYKWTDAQGTVHYSQTRPPTGAKYSKIDLDTHAPAPDVAQNGSVAAAGSSPGSARLSGNGAPAPPMQDTPENREKFCTLLKASISTLQGSDPVVIHQGEGQHLLDADQRKQQLLASQSQYNQYCANPQPP